MYIMFTISSQYARCFMTNKPLSLELTPQEIDEFEKNLNKPSTIKRLKATQAAILDILKNSCSVGNRISNYREREDIKSTESALEKINDHRRDGETFYSADSCKDMIGAQIICPYPDDVHAVIDWLYSSGGGRHYFNIVSPRSEITRKQAERENRTGYRAYHICLKLKKPIAAARSLPSGSEHEHFELQIKTTLEAGWDFKTHDISYKAIIADPELQQHMKLISSSLYSIDQQTLLLRDQIVEEQIMLQELRVAAGRLLFCITLGDDEKKQLGIDNINIEQWQQKELEELEKTLELQRQRDGINRAYTVGLALLALCSQSSYKSYEQEKALSYASYLVSQALEKAHDLDYISSLRVRALLRWAFHKTRHAVEDMRYLVEHTGEVRDKNDYVYYVTELREPTQEDLQLAAKCIKSLDINADLEFKDTLGAYYICLGETVDDLRNGLKLVREAKEQARDSRLQSVLDAFCSYHEYVYLRRLSKVRRMETLTR